MEEKNNPLGQYVLFAILILGLLAVILGLPPLVESFNPEVCTVNGVCQHEERLVLVEKSLPFFVGIGVVAGAGIYWFMSRQLAKKYLEE